MIAATSTSAHIEQPGTPLAEPGGQGALADAAASPAMSRRLLATRIAQASAPMPAPVSSAGQADPTDLDVRRAADRDQAEEDEDEHLTEPAVAVRPPPAGVVPGGEHAGGPDREQPPVAGEQHQHQTGQPATAKLTSAARRTAGGAARPEPTSRSGPTRSASVPRMPSE